MFRVLYITATGLGWAVLLLVLAGWAASATTLVTANLPVAGGWGVALGSLHGQLAVRVGEIGTFEDPGVVIAQKVVWAERRPVVSPFVFRAHGSPGADKSVEIDYTDPETGGPAQATFLFLPGGQRRSIMTEMPYPVWMLLAAIVPVFTVFRRWGRVLLPGYCKHCHYNLRGLPKGKPCPECGQMTDGLAPRETGSR